MKRCMGCMEEYKEGGHICPICGYDEETKPAEVYHMVPGSIIAGKYIVGRALGYGGFGVTYIGYDAELERKIAIKEYLPGEFSTRVPGQTQVTVYDGERGEQFQSGIEKFLDEAKRLAKFQNTDGVVHIYDSFMENDTAYIVMEYIDGETVKTILEREKTLSLEDSLKIILPVVSAMKEVHKAGIIHRDISPDNIMVSKEGKVSLIDFGASRFATTTYSKSLSVLIKPGYAPVEQYQSRGEQGLWTDVYALAATFYTMLTGMAPADSMERQGGEVLKSPAKMGAKISKKIDNAIMNALNVKVEERTQSMEDFERELLSTGEVARLTEKKEKKDVGKWPLWVKIAMGIAAVAIALVGVLFGTGVIQFSEGTFVPVIITAGKAKVPNLVNTTVETAQEKATEQKLGIQILDKQYSTEIPENLVLSQSIEVGVVVEESTVLDLVVSAGVEKVRVPSVEGLSQENAIAILEESGLTYHIEKVESMVAIGAVVSQSMEPETEVEAGTEIVLQVSTGVDGLDVTVEVEMPDIQNMDYTQAQEKLAELGLHILKATESYDNSVAKGKIIYQSVPAGNILHQGDTVEVNVSLGKQQVRVPDVQYKSEEEAKQKLADAGLMVEVVRQTSDIVPKGNVISQGTAAKELVDIGSTVKIVISTGKAETENSGSTGSSSNTGNNGNTGSSGGSTNSGTNTPVVKNWSAWSDSLPAGVTSDKYEIETKTQYASRDKSTITSQDSSLAAQGWTLEKTDTSYGQWGTWSGWSDSSVTESDTVNAETKTQYRYKDKAWQYQEGTASQKDGWETYGSYVNWGSTYETRDPGAETETHRIVGQYEVAAVTHAEYHYSHYHHWSSSQGRWMTASQDFGGAYGVYSPASLGPLLSPLPRSEAGAEGVPRYSGSRCSTCNIDWWYNESVNTIVDTPAYMMYQVQDGTKIYQYKQLATISDWSGWADAYVESSELREVETKSVYRYQQRPVIYTYTYSKWSDWSDYSDNSVSSSATREVRTKTLYRYKEK